MFWLL